MKHTLPGIVGAAMIVLAGCSSKSAVSTADQTGAGTGSDTGSGANAGTVAGPVLGDIFYGFDSSAVSTESQEQLKQNAAWMQSHAAQAVTIEGHCDERGTDEYNIALGERRANSAKEYLVTLGISSTKLSTVSYGEERPFDPGHNEEAWAKNRRAHFLTK
ncbi:MAG: peptidoglycan-associated lipoprotein Pal [Chlorobiaceae bacterium]|nr:peptidoglycan-associated lipoprotein Pal [Chlorobiaceae bacterium]NTW74238.1 peptidoglycan-associated lipoprotein Pal [Chlorobiaceae bacterium]